MLFPERLHWVDKKYDPVENIESFKKFWRAGDNFFTYRKSKIKSHTHSFFGGVDYQKSSKIMLKFQYDPSLDWRQIFYDLVGAYDASFGYLHLITDNEFEKTEPHGDGFGNFFMGVYPVDRVRGYPKRGLLHLGWLTFYGKEFLELVGKNMHLLPVENCSVVNNKIFIQLSDNIHDLITDYESINMIRMELKEIIGLEYFQTYPTTDPNMKFSDYFFK